ncbi:hypothetical protein BSKO_10911 [Bryopsis sp. KO-2023]|nr:hypothetical protein BSKO_10911 [Bryopsis sp. KO-2023]
MEDRGIVDGLLLNLASRKRTPTTDEDAETEGEGVAVVGNSGDEGGLIGETEGEGTTPRPEESPEVEKSVSAERDIDECNMTAGEAIEEDKQSDACSEMTEDDPPLTSFPAASHPNNRTNTAKPPTPPQQRQPSPGEMRGLEASQTEFLDELAEKVLESKKLTRNKEWTMKDVLATGHLLGMEVEFREKMSDPMGSGVDGVIMEDGKIHCECKKCRRSQERAGFTGTKWEEHFGGRSQRPFRHIFFRHIDISLKDFCDEWCEKLDKATLRKRKSKRAGSSAPSKRRAVSGGPRCGECDELETMLPCEGCEAQFHLECLGMKRMPAGRFYCGDCVENGRDAIFPPTRSLRHARRSGAETDGSPSSQKKHNGGIPKNNGIYELNDRNGAWLPEGKRKLMEVSNGCMHILRELDYVCGSCALCGSPDYEEVNGKWLSPRTIIICDTCECEYHIGCLRNNKMADLKELPDGDWFCSEQCKRTNSVLLAWVRQGERIISFEKKLTYCVLRGRLTDRDDIPKIKRVEEIVTACFDPIKDAITGENLLPMMVRGQRLANSWDFSGFHCVILKCGSCWVATALFKVYKDSAEVPFVATEPSHRRKGYSLKIMQILENLVRKAGAKKLLLPSAEATVEMWMKPKFGFTAASEDYNRGNRFLQFPGTVWLEKILHD